MDESAIGHLTRGREFLAAAEVLMGEDGTGHPLPTVQTLGTALELLMKARLLGCGWQEEDTAARGHNLDALWNGLVREWRDLVDALEKRHQRR